MSIQLKPGKWRTRDGRVAVVEFRTANPNTNTPWLGYVVGFVGAVSWAEDGLFTPDNSDSGFDIIAHYTEPRLRPWKPEEVPAVLVVRPKPGTAFAQGLTTKWWVAWAISETGISIGSPSIGNDGRFTFSDCLNNLDHSIDNGKTWKPCGVMEGGE